MDNAILSLATPSRPSPKNPLYPSAIIPAYYKINLVPQYLRTNPQLTSKGNIMTTYPRINLNGTDGAELTAKVNEAVKALALALTALEVAAPHGRDFQTYQDARAYGRARLEWEECHAAVRVALRVQSAILQDLQRQMGELDKMNELVARETPQGSRACYPPTLAGYQRDVIDRVQQHYNVQLPKQYVANGLAYVWCMRYIERAWRCEVRVDDAAFVLCNKIQSREWEKEKDNG